MTNEEKLEVLVKDMLNTSPTFSEEMIKKIQKELIKAGEEAEDYYKKKAED